MGELIDKLVGVGYNDDVITAMENLYEQFKDLPWNRELTSTINKDWDIDCKCQTVFGYLEDCKIRYKLDPGDKQLIRTPERLIEKEKCGDCKSLTMFIACCLHTLGISHIIRFVSFDNRKIFSHVYAVALDENGEEIILDACEVDPKGARIYDYARPYTYKHDLVYYE